MNVRHRSLVGLVLGTALGAALCALLPPQGVRAQGTVSQGTGEQLVDSLDAYQRRIEGLVSERLDALLPQHNYVLRATVSGRKVAVPKGAPSSTMLQLPGFEPAAGQSTGVEEKFRVDQVAVKIIVNGDLRPEDAQYLRTIVPILADLHPERGDHLDLQVLPAAFRAPGASTSATAGGPAESAEGQGGPPAPGGPLLPNLSLTTWVALGLLALICFLLLVVALRLLFMGRGPGQAMMPPPSYPSYAPPSYAPPPYAPPPSRASRSRAQPDYEPPPSPAASAERAAERALRAEPVSRKEQEEERRAQEQERYFESVRSSVVKTLFARPDLGRTLMDEWQGEKDKLTLLVHAMGPNLARQALLPQMEAARYRDVEDEVRQDDPPEREKEIAVLREANLYLIAQELEHPEAIRPDPFAFLNDLSRGQIAHLIKPEPVRVKAIVLSRIPPEYTANIMETLPKDVQLEIAIHIGNLQSLPLDMLESVAQDLADKVRTVPDARTVDIEGPKALVDMMGRASPGTSLYLLQAMKSKDRHLAEAVEKRFFVFDAIPLVPDDLLPQAVRGIPSAVVVQALVGAPQDLQRKVIMAFPEQARAGLVNSVKAAKADEATVAAARRQLVARFQTLAQQGKIDLKKISDAWQAQAKAS